MNNENQSIRHQFLALACQYLFGQNARCENYRHLSLQPIPVNGQSRSRQA